MTILNSIINIKLDEEQDVFLFCSFDNDKRLQISLLDINKCKAFSGCATDIDLRSQAAIIRMTFSDFLSLSTNALTKKELDGVKFLYSLEKNCEHFLFMWKSIDEEETIINIGSLKVMERQYSSVIKEIFMTLSNELSNLNSKVSSLEGKLLTIGKEKEDAVKLASKSADIKDQIETELFSKFILVLNQKKEKIKNLKKHKTSDFKPVSKRTKTVKKLHQISDSSDEAPSDLEKVDVMKPSTSKHNISLPFLDDDNERPILPSPSKRRIRQNNSKTEKVISVENRCKESPKIIVESESEDELLLNL